MKFKNVNFKEYYDAGFKVGYKAKEIDNTEVVLENFEELLIAIKESDNYKKDEPLKISFRVGTDRIEMYSDELENRYGPLDVKEEDYWRWEIELKNNGEWRIF